MYIDTVPNRNSRPAILLRESRREGRKTVKTTLANMTDWPAPVVEAIRLALQGHALVPAKDLFAVERSLPHGHVQAVLGTIRRLELDTLIASKPCRERDLVLALLVERLLQPASKLATHRLWSETTAAQELGVQDASVDEVYRALDWLASRQARIEAKLAKRHLVEGARVLYDVSSSSYHGTHCPLARWGYNRDGEKLPSIVFGVLTDARGRPLALQVYPGNTADSKTVPDRVTALRERFKLLRVVLVGDRGMLTETQLETLRTYPGLGWISALRSGDIRALLDEGRLQLSLFDAVRLAEIVSPEFPGERLMACYNPLLAEDRRRTRDELLEATERALAKIAQEAARRTHTPLTDEVLGAKVGKALQAHKMGKHIRWSVTQGRLQFAREEASLKRERELDGLYVIRTSEPADALSASDAVRHYKDLADVERVFRGMKGLDIQVRPIYHRTPTRVEAHYFVCLLAYYVEWHLREALAPLLFQDEELAESRATRNPVARAEASASAREKKQRRETPDGLALHSLRTLLAALGTRCRNTCRVQGATGSVERVTLLTEPTPLQRRAFELLGIKP